MRAQLYSWARAMLRPGENWLELALQASVLLLVMSVLVQVPLGQPGSGAALFSIRPWDVFWASFVLLALPWLAPRRHAVRQLLLGGPRSLQLLVLFVALATISLVWGYVNFGSSQILECAIRAVRLAGVALLAITLSLLLDEKRASLLSIVIVAVASLAALMACAAWLTEVRPSTESITLVGVSRAGGPFGNYLADGQLDHSWAGPAGPNSLGFWLAIGLGVLAGWVLLRRTRNQETNPGLLVGLCGVAAVLAAALFATQSRESWLATAACYAMLITLAWPRLDIRLRYGAAVLVPTCVVAVVLAVPSLRHRVSETLDSPQAPAYQAGPSYGLAPLMYPQLLRSSPSEPGALSRTKTWSAGLEWGIDSYGAGWGLGEIEEHPQYFGGPTSENTFIQSFAQLGIAGVVLLLALCAIGLWESLAALKQGRSLLMALFAAAFFSVLLVHGMFGNTLGDPSVQILLGCAVGILGALFTKRAGTSRAQTLAAGRA